MVTTEEYVEAVKAPMREIRAYMVGGESLDWNAHADVASVSALSNVDATLTDWDALTDGRTEGGAVVSLAGAVSMSVRMTFNGTHGGPVTVHTSDASAVTAIWRDSTLKEVSRMTVAGDGKSRRFPMADLSGDATVLDITVESDGTGRIELREIVFGIGDPLDRGVLRIEWDESRGHKFDRWTVNELTLSMALGIDEGSPVRRGNRLALAMDVTCPSGIVRVPCGVWLVDSLSRSGGRLTVTAYDGRILLSEKVDAELVASTGKAVGDILATLGWGFVDIYPDKPLTVDDGDLSEVVGDKGTYSDLIWRALLRAGSISYMRDDGRISYSEFINFDDPADGSGLTAPIRWTIGPEQVYERVESMKSDTYRLVVVRWPGGQMELDGFGSEGSTVIDLPVLPKTGDAPNRLSLPRFRLRWSGDPQFWGIDSGTSAEFDMDDVPGASYGGFEVDHVEHVFDGGYMQEVQFFGDPGNLEN